MVPTNSKQPWMTLEVGSLGGAATEAIVLADTSSANEAGIATRERTTKAIHEGATTDEASGGLTGRITTILPFKDVATQVVDLSLIHI